MKVALIPDQFHTTDKCFCKADSGVRPPQMNDCNIDKTLWLEIKARENKTRQYRDTLDALFLLYSCTSSVLSPSPCRLARGSVPEAYLSWTSNAAACFEKTSLKPSAKTHHRSRTRSRRHRSRPTAPPGLLLGQAGNAAFSDFPVLFKFLSGRYRACCSPRNKKITICVRQTL